MKKALFAVAILVALAPVARAEVRVEFSADLSILQPKDASRRNGVALVEVSNRGGKELLSGFARASASRDPATNNHLGDGFLTAPGYTLAWVGWQFDVARENAIL